MVLSMLDAKVEQLVFVERFIAVIGLEDSAVWQHTLMRTRQDLVAAVLEYGDVEFAVKYIKKSLPDFEIDGQVVGMKRRHMRNGVHTN